MNFYDSIIEGAQALSVEERGELYVACIEYLFFDGREPDFDMCPAVQALFVSHKVSFDRQIAKKANGRKGGQAKAAGKSPAKTKQGAGKPEADAKQAPSEPLANAKQTASKAPSKTLANAKQTPSEQEQEIEEEKPSAYAEGKKKPRRFVPPTAEEVDAYIAEKGYSGFTGQQVVDYYAASGWRRGNTPIRDWKACVRTWWNKRANGPRGAPRANMPDFSAYDLVEEAI